MRPPAAVITRQATAQQYEDEIAAIEDDLLGEIEHIQRAAAARERFLIAERDAYRAQLDFVTSTKAWRASVAYWRARAQGMSGIVGLLWRLTMYVARVGYHVGVPYRVRRDLWYLRHTGRSYRSYYRALGELQTDANVGTRLDPGNDQRANVIDVSSIKKALGPDIICFPAKEWKASTEERRHLVYILAEAGHRCCWLNPHLTPPTPITSTSETGAREARAHSVSVGVDEINLPGDGSVVTARPIFRRSTLRRALTALRAFCSQQDFREVVCLVQHPGWMPLVNELQRMYGWKVIYDLGAGDRSIETQPDEDTSSAARGAGQPEREQLQSMVATSDLIVTREVAAYERLRTQGVSVKLLPDTDEYNAFMSAVRQCYGRATIVIVSYRNLDTLRLTLTSVLEKTRYPQYDILIVDNGGQPAIQDYVRALARRFPDTVRFIFNPENLGFAGGNNVGLRAARESDYLVLLNDDVIVTPGWLGVLIRYLSDRRIGLVGPVTNSCGNEARVSIDYSDPTQADTFARHYTLDHDGVSFDIAVLAMYCIAMRQNVVAEIGELDERFRFGMFEDDDFALRVHNAGYRVVCAEDVYVHHFGSASFGKLGEDAYMQLFNANRALFEQKWQTTWQSHKYREGYQP